jgi:hypothetical protein
LFLELQQTVVERGQDVENEEEKLDLGPVVLTEGPEGKVVVIHLEGEPRPFDLSGLTLVLMEIFE